MVPGNGLAFGTQFSVTLSFAQVAGTSGYLFSRCNSAGERYFAIFLGSSGRVYVFYALQGQAVSSINYVSFDASASLGGSAAHTLMVTVNATGVSAYLDYQLAYSTAIAGTVADCVGVSSDCVTSLGGRAGANPGNFAGNITSATLQTIALVGTTTTTTTQPSTATTTTPGKTTTKY